MRRFACIGFALAALIALPAFGRAEAATTFPTRMQISGDEYWVTLSRLKVPTGKVKIEFVNYGEDPHDVKLRRFGRTKVYSIPKTESGERAIRTFKLIPGPLPRLVRDRRPQGEGHVRRSAREAPLASA